MEPENEERMSSEIDESHSDVLMSLAKSFQRTKFLMCSVGDLLYL